MLRVSLISLPPTLVKVGVAGGVFLVASMFSAVSMPYNDVANNTVEALVTVGKVISVFYSLQTSPSSYPLTPTSTSTYTHGCKL